MSTRAQLEAAIEQHRVDLANLEHQLANMPNTIGKLQRNCIEYPGSVLRLTITFGTTSRASTYQYAAIFAGGQWHLTGSTTPFCDHDPMSWDELCAFVAGAHKAIAEHLVMECTFGPQYLGAA